MAILPCSKAFLASYASNMSVTVNANCYLRKGLLNGSIDSLLIATEDCQVTNCKTLLTEIYVYTSTDCNFVEAQTGNLWPWSKLKQFCDIPVAPGPAPTSAPSFKPMTLPPTATTKPGITTSPKTTASTSDSSNPSEILGLTQPKEESNNNAIIIGVAIGAALLVLAIVVFIWRRRKQQSGKAPTSNDIAAPPAYASVQDDYSVAQRDTATQPPKRGQSSMGTATRTNTIGSKSSGAASSASAGMATDGPLDMCGLEMHRIASNEVRPVQAIAQGAYGEVWLGQYMGEKVALKKLLASKGTSITELQKFIWEIKLLSKINSPYVVRFIGVTWTKPADIMLVTEFMDGGDLRSVLQNNAVNRTFTWRHKIQCALDVAEGLVYLHSMDPRVIHRDLKSRNVLLDSEYFTKITDFGIARETDDTTMTAGIGTYRWMAPEVLMDGHYSELADLFSFGVILSELDTEVLPYSDLRNASGSPFTDTAIMAKVMIGQMQPSFSATCPEWFSTLAKECLALAPAARPSAMQVAYRLRLHVEEDTM